MPKTSAGILPYRGGTDAPVEVVLVHPGGPFWARRDEHAWSVAKGETLPDEDPLAAAEREFAEELGFPAPRGPRPRPRRGPSARGKVVHVWAVRSGDLPLEAVASNRFEMEWPPNSGTMQLFPEVDRAEWMTVARARTRLVRAQAEFLDRLLVHIEGGR